MKPVTLQHWTDGGTAVTNFSSDQDVMEEAVREFNDPRLVIVSAAFPPHMPGAQSLHWLGNRRANLSGFWELYRVILNEKRFAQTVTTNETITNRGE